MPGSAADGQANVIKGPMTQGNAAHLASASLPQYPFPVSFRHSEVCRMTAQERPPEPILAIDQFLHPNTFRAVGADVARLSQWKREVDFVGATPVGETCDVPAGTPIFTAMADELKKTFRGAWRMDRFYVNRFQPGEVPRFHEDGEVLTCLLYADARDWRPDDHGETQILIGGEIRGILPIANRLLVFDGRLLHRATPFRDRQRHTVAAKLEGVTLADLIVPG
jgi:hypothetical protein